MATTPVIVILWLDPPLQSDFQLGDSVTWHAAFLDRETHAPVTPDVINFIYSNPPQLGATTVTLVADSTGLCHLDLPLTLIGKYILTTAALGNPGSVGIGNQSIEIYVSGTGQ